MLSSRVNPLPDFLAIQTLIWQDDSAKHHSDMQEQRNNFQYMGSSILLNLKAPTISYREKMSSMLVAND